MVDCFMKREVVRVEDMTMAYHDKPVLWDLDLSITEGSRTAIIGPNGAGKSTLLKGILGLKKPLSGKIEIFGGSVGSALKRIAYIPQRSSVNWDFPTTVLDVTLMGRYGHLGWFKRPGREDIRIAEQALELMEIQELSKRQISQLSGGQRQRVFIARAIAQEAELYFMDEPLAGVDKKTEGIIIDFLKKIQSEGRTSVVVHHDLNTITEYFDHLAIINRHLIAEGSVDKVFTAENLERAMMMGGK